MTNKKDQENLLAGINKLRKVTQESNPLNVCEHIIENTSKIQSARYIATQILDDSYFILWCCESCAKEYHVPKPGVLVVDHPFIEDDQFITNKSKNNDQNPYEKLIESCKGRFIREDLFSKHHKNLGKDQIMNSRYKINFGKEIVGIVSD